MIKTESRFQIVGTNPYHYIDNFINDLNSIPIGTIVIADLDKYVIRLESSDEILFSGNSEATLKQNIDTWMSLGYIIKIGDNRYLKIIEETTMAKLLDYSSIIIFQEHFDEKINMFRNTIRIKLMYLIDKEYVSNNLELYSASRLKPITLEDIHKSTGTFEKEIIERFGIKELTKLLMGGK